MANNWFQFKQFTVYHRMSAMKVGTDGVLLGAWTNGDGARRILDIGTGSGLLALMMAQRYSTCQITAIDIVADAVDQAKENVDSSPWNDRITVLHHSLQEFVVCNTHQFDVVICNPPYFTNSLNAPDAQRNIARHNHDLPFDELARGVAQLLSDKGHLSVVIPVDQQEVMTNVMGLEGLYPHRILNVFPLPYKPAKRVLIEYSRDPIDCKFNQLVIETGDRHCYSDEYRELTKDFYLKF